MGWGAVGGVCVCDCLGLQAHPTIQKQATWLWVSASVKHPETILIVKGTI